MGYVWVITQQQTIQASFGYQSLSKKSHFSFCNLYSTELKWNVFPIKNVIDFRLDNFRKYFSESSFNVGQIDCTYCPYPLLPSNWEQYLQNFLGSNTDQNLRRRLKKVESTNEFYFLQTQANNLEHQIEPLLTLWQMRWGLKLERDLEIKRNIFRRCFKNSCLWLNVLWKEITPVAAIAIFTEPQRKTFYFYITGYGAKFSNLAPGRVVMSYNIKYAIKNGFQTYDFLKGDKKYKFSYFGAKKRFSTNVVVTRTSL